MRKCEYKKYEAYEKIITPCLCSWFDLLGYGKPFVDSKWNLSAAWQRMQMVSKMMEVEELNS